MAHLTQKKMLEKNSDLQSFFKPAAAIKKPKTDHIQRPFLDPETNLNHLYDQAITTNTDIELEPEDITPTIVGLEYLKEKRQIPLGTLIHTNKIYFLPFPPITDATYNVWMLLSPMGGGKTNLARALIYYTAKFEPDCINIVFDPMKMEYAKLALATDTVEKRKHLLNHTAYDQEAGENITITVEPGNLPIYHIIPRFSLNREQWNQESLGYEKTYDKTSIDIMKKDGGFIFAEDASKMSEEQLFASLNYRETRAEQVIHFYLRAAIRICNNKHGEREWFIQDLIQVLRDSVKKFATKEEIDDIGTDEEGEGKGGLSRVELQLIEQLEKYQEVGFFVTNEEERAKYCIDFRIFIQLNKVLIISFLGFRRADKFGEDIIVGQTDLILERLNEISNEYYDAVRKVEQNTAAIQEYLKKMNKHRPQGQKMSFEQAKQDLKEGLRPISTWEDYLLRKWKVNLWFEESEIFVPRDCPAQNLKKWPCIKRLNDMLSIGRKYGFKNFCFITQRIAKLNTLVFKEISHLFIGPIHGEDRDQILSDFGVQKIQFNITDTNGITRPIALRDIVTTLNKDKHEWIFVDKSRKSICAIRAFESPCG